MSDDDRMDEDVESGEEEEESPDLPDSDVVTKYKTGAEITNRALAQVIAECLPGKKVYDLCVLGDKLMLDAVNSVFKTKNLEKGVAFPTCVSVNNVVGHYSPLEGDTVTLQEGDVVKVDLGVQIDGFISMAAHTVVASSTANAPVTGRKADVILAAHYAAECAHRLLKPGKKNSDVTEAIKKVAEQFKVSPVEGVISHQMKRFVIDGNNCIINKETLEHKVEEFEFEENQAYCIDIVMSTGEGKAREMETRTTVYKRAVDQNYLLKLKAARYVFNEINSRFPTFPFTVRALEEKKGKLGITEMLKHDLLHPYPVLYEKNGEFVAQVKFTVLILGSATDRITGHPLGTNVVSENKIEDPSVNAILALGTKRTKKNKKKKTSEKKKTEGTDKAAPMETN